MKEWNPRYLAYCEATGALGPEATMRRDRETYPGGHMAGFILWIGQEWREWHAERGRVRFAQPLSTVDHEDFDVWLQKRSARAAGHRRRMEKDHFHERIRSHA